MSLTKDGIVRAALDLLDETGLEGLTLRRLGDRLGVKAPALYWYVASKADLLDEMATAMLQDLLAGGETPSEEWTEVMRAAASGLRAMMLARRDGARVFARTSLTDEVTVVVSDGPVRVLTAAGFPLAQAVMAWQTIYCFVVGCAIEEQAVRAEADARYTFGVEAIVSGLAALLPAQRGQDGVDLPERRGRLRPFPA